MSYHLEVPSTVRGILASVYSVGIKSGNVLGEVQSFDPVYPRDTAFRVGLAKLALVEFGAATGFLIRADEYTSPDDFALLLAQTVPWHLAKAFQELSVYNGFGFIRRWSSGCGYVETSINIPFAHEELMRIFGKRLVDARSRQFNTGAVNPLLKYSLSVKKFTTWFGSK